MNSEVKELTHSFHSLSLFEEDKIIKIQKWFRGFLIRKYLLIPSSEYQTKQWRKNKNWYFNGKKNECEIYQVKIIEEILRKQTSKTNDRINIETYKISSNNKPLIKIDGFEWTENFDRKLKHKDKILYFNLKFVCDKGGAQTRTLREVYHFIKCQLEYLIRNKNNNIYFINILDGDTSFFSKEKFKYLINKSKFKNIKNFIFCDDMNNFQKWYYCIDKDLRSSDISSCSKIQPTIL